MISHRDCTHPSTSRDRRACRQGQTVVTELRPPVVGTSYRENPYAHAPSCAAKRRGWTRTRDGRWVCGVCGALSISTVL